MDIVEVTKNSVRITKANGLSTAQINKILQGIKLYHSFPVEIKSASEAKSCNSKADNEKKKVTVILEC